MSRVDEEQPISTDHNQLQLTSVEIVFPPGSPVAHILGLDELGQLWTLNLAAGYWIPFPMAKAPLGMVVEVAPGKGF